MAMLIDVLLGVTLLWLAWRVLDTADLYESVVLFVTFGLLMALVWMRLDAPDVAMAEAAIGAGLTGALLMSALARLSPSTTAEQGGQGEPPAAHSRIAAAGFVLLLGIGAAGLGALVLALPQDAPGLSAQVASAMPRSGVEHAVTAVLLNFRGYDTLLELVVLLLVATSVRSLGSLPAQPGHLDVSPVLQQLAQWLVPVLIIVSCYLLWIGSKSPGGAFQAGATLGGAGVLLVLGFPDRARALQRAGRGALLSAGVLAFVAVAALGLFAEGALLAYPPAFAGALILFIEAVATLSIAVTLVLLFAGPPEEAATPGPAPDPAGERK
jgi:multisubunit Na+/H+ antiporter MnhB subunit